MKFTRYRPLATLALLLLLLFPAALPNTQARQSATPELSYRISALPNLPDRPFFQSIATEINEQGQVVGTIFLSETESAAVLWENGTAIDLGSLGGSTSFGRAITEDGRVAGSSALSIDTRGTPAVHAFVWENGSMTDLGALPGCNSTASSINALGEIAGSSIESHDCAAGLLWKDGAITDLGGVPPRIFTPATIDDNGIIVGAVGVHGGDPTAALWENGVITLLPEPADAISQAVDMNAAGTVVGFYASHFDSSGRAVTWVDGTMNELPIPDGFHDAYARGINDRGQIVGDVHALTQGDAVPNSRCVLWQSGDMIDLADSLVNGEGWEVISLTDINNRGEIVGIGRFNGEQRAILLTPEQS